MKYELDRMVIHPLWPTNVYALKTEDLNLMPVIQQEKVKEIGRNRSNVGGYQSHQHMDKVVGFKPLIEQITKFFRTIKQIPGYDTIQDIQIPQMWFNINTRGNYNEIHNHGNQYQFSGTYYVKVPNKCGRICFRDPRQGAVSNEFHFRYSQVNFGTNYHATKIIALHDGTTAYHSEYGTIYNNQLVALFNVDISGGNIRLVSTASTSDTTNYTINFTATKI